MERTGTVAVILVGYPGYAERHLPECYASLSAQTYPTDRVTIFIVMNGVTQDGAAFVRRVAPAARLLHHVQNLGWAAGNNTAIQVALAEEFDYLVLLNMDTVVDPDWLTRLVEAAEEQPQLHILQSTLLIYGTDRINSLGNRIHYLGYGFCHGNGTVRTGSTRAPTIDYASGAAMLVTREVFERIGLLRAGYFMYYDDMEFSWRARIAGFNVGLAAQSVCYHKYSSQNAINHLYYAQRNRLMTLLTCARLGTLLLIAPCLLVAELVVSGYCLAKGWGRTPWRVVGYFCRPATWREIHNRRRELRRLRRRRDADIVWTFAGRIGAAHVLTNPLLRYVGNPALSLYWALVRRLIIW